MANIGKFQIVFRPYLSLKQGQMKTMITQECI